MKPNEPDINRESVKKWLGRSRDFQMEIFKQERKGRIIHGQNIEITIGGRIRNIMCYGMNNKNAPVYFDIHGGGFVWGTIDSGDIFCHELSEHLGIQVYSLDYPLIPDVEYPESLIWCYETINFMKTHADIYGFDANKMIIGGRSAGGNLAAALCLMAKKYGDLDFICQVLDHPWLDLCGIIPPDERFCSDETLTSELMETLATAYASESSRQEIYCSPLNASREELQGISPAIIQVCEIDYLRPDGERYAKILRNADVDVNIRCCKGALHGFTEEDSKKGEDGRTWLIEKIAAALTLPHHHP